MNRNFSKEPLSDADLHDIATVREWISQGWANAGPVSLKVMEHYIDRASDAEMTAETRGARVANLERAIREFCAKCSEQSCRECPLEIAWEVD